MNKVLILFPALLLLSCATKPATEAGNQAEQKTSNLAAAIIQLSDAQIKNSDLLSGYAEEKNMSSLLKVNGRIDVPPQNIVSISVPLGGYLKSTQLLPGMHVKKGEVIATMEDQQYIQVQQDYLTALAKLRYTEGDYNRQKSLNESKASSDKVFQQTEADYKTELILVRSLNEKLKLIGIDPASLDENTLSRSIRIKAPIDGFVSAVNVNIGKYVNPSDVLFELVNPSDIHLSLRVFEKDLDKLEIGQKLEAYSNSHPDKKYACGIILISRNFSEDRSVEVHCHFENYDKTLIPGMYMNAAIHTRSGMAWVVPEAAVVDFEGKQYLFSDLGKGNYEMLEVSPGPAEGGYVAVPSLGGRHQKIVLRGAYSLLMAMKNKSES